MKRVVWFNDTKNNQYLSVDVLNEMITVLPQEYRVVDVNVPENRDLWIKQWTNGQVLISTIEKNIVDNELIPQD